MKKHDLFLLIIGLLVSLSAELGSSDNSTERAIEDNNTYLSEYGKQNPFLEWISGLVGRPTSPTKPPPPSQDITNCHKCTCGIANKKRRIVGGHETIVNQYPWVAQLLYSNRFYCGATLINDRYVLTAAHCISGFSHDRVTVRLLDHNRGASSSQKIDRKVKKVIRHSSYSSTTYNNDIALLRLDRPVELKDPVRPACLPTPGKPFTGDTGIVTGWGALRENGMTSDTLQEVDVPIMSNAECRKSAYGATRITDNMLCAGHKKGMKDSCQGDSGGPLHVLSGNAYQVVGVVSWGEGCAQANYPGVYARVNRYGTWIRSNTRDACYC